MTDQPTRLGEARPDEPAPPPLDRPDRADETRSEAIRTDDATEVIETVDTNQSEENDPDVEVVGTESGATAAEVPLSEDGPDVPFWRRRSSVVVAAVLGAALVVYLGAYLIAGRDLASGATVLGVEVGDLSTAEAEAVLAAELPALVDTPISLHGAGDDSTFSIVPSESGLSIDITATVDDVPGASADPISVFRALFGAGPVDPVPVVDREALEAAVAVIAEQTDTDPVNGSVGFEDGEVVTSAAVPGRSVDVSTTADAVAAAYFGTDGPHALPIDAVELAMTEVAPAVDDADVERAVTDFAEPAMSGPVTVVAEGRSGRLEPDVIGTALTMEPGDGGGLIPALDGAKLAEAAEQALADIGQQGRDASIRIEGGRPVIVPARTGRGVMPDALAAAVLPALTAGGGDRTAEVELTATEPELTTEGAEKLGVVEVVAEWTTRFPHADYRNTNIGLAARRIDDTLLLPGETFSLNELVGERTAANGFAVGWTIDAGRLREDYGGGVSQVATTTYHAAFKAGLEDVYHQPHSIYFDRYPVGQEATVSWGAFDMSFRNDTPYGVLVDTQFSPSGERPGALTVKIWSTAHLRVETSVSARSNPTDPQTIYDTGEECAAQQGWQGFSITSYRKVWTPDGELVKDEAFPWTYRPNPTVVCGPEPGAGD
ncbi:MAG TPA: VanW family protein [Jiangellaceae bacterium]|nr:VanW family protein [Jiangellaceae bacterium]